MSDTDVILVTS